MAIAAIIVGAAGGVLSFIIPFPFSIAFGPPVGLILGAIAFIFAAVAPKNKNKKLKMWALIVSGAILGISIARLISLFSCAGRLGGIVTGFML